MDHPSIIFVPTMLGLEMEDVTLKIMLELVTMMVVIVVQTEIRLMMAFVMKKTRIKSVISIGLTVAKTGN